MAISIYWCLLLLECLPLVVSLLLVQTTPPSPTLVCPGSKLVFTCSTTRTSNLFFWVGYYPGHQVRLITSTSNPGTAFESFHVTAAQVGNTLESNFTNESVPLQMDGTIITCSDDYYTSRVRKTVNIADKPESVNNIMIYPMSGDDSLFIEWSASESLCIDHYNVTIISNNTNTESITTNSTNLIIDAVISDTDYSFIIVPVDTGGREGPPSAIEYTRNVSISATVESSSIIATNVQSSVIIPSVDSSKQLTLIRSISTNAFTSSVTAYTDSPYSSAMSTQATSTASNSLAGLDQPDYSNTATPTTTDTGSNIAPIILGGISGAVLLIMFAILMIIVAIKKHRKDSSTTGNDVDHSSIHLDLNSAYQRHHHHHQEEDEISTDDTIIEQLLIKYLIPSSQIDVQEAIGQGEFGIVYKATMTAMDESEQEIAFKTLKGAFSKSDVNCLLEECLLMSNFDNPNVLSLIGVCADLGSAPCIIMPYMSRGSLLSYLQKEKSHLIVEATSEERTVLNVRKQLLSVCLQVANGMNYLASQRFIHRDLAARNCLIADNGVIKVADFGLSEEIYTKNYFNQFKESKSVKLPVKWMALESLHYGIFSEKSDVWSYGILCWEVFSAGKIPYPGMDPIGLVELLDEGQRLSCPHNEACSEDIYFLMEQCWCESSDDRPLFSDLVASVNELIKPLAPYLIVSNDSTFQLNHDHIYY